MESKHKNIHLKEQQKGNMIISEKDDWNQEMASFGLRVDRGEGRTMMTNQDFLCKILVVEDQLDHMHATENIGYRRTPNSHPS
jgi:hypothetical protein